jgi:hypothetical protein
MMNLSLKKKFALPLAALGAALAMSAMAPTGAQARSYDDRYSDSHVSYRYANDFDFRDLKARIWQGVRNGDLTRREARRLSYQVDSLEERADYYSRDGLQRWERQELRDRYRDISARIYVQRRDDDYRGGHWR